MAFGRITQNTPRSRLRPPPGACDSHMHFYNARFPSAPSALITPDDAWIGDYRALQAHLGLERVVVVQPTTYGLDNSCQIEAMAAFGDSARGVFVVDDSVGEKTLERLTALGGRGARFHMLPGGALPWEMLEPVAERIAPFGWHIQLQLNGRELPDRVARLKRLPCPLVIDHIARFTPPVEAGHPALQALLDLLDTGRCWVKLSAPYESFGEEERPVVHEIPMSSRGAGEDLDAEGNARLEQADKDRDRGAGTERSDRAEEGRDKIARDAALAHPFFQAILWQPGADNTNEKDHDR